MNDGPTIAARFRKLPPDCPEPVRSVVSMATARDMAERAFWRGLVIGGCLIGGIFIASLALT